MKAPNWAGVSPIGCAPMRPYSPIVYHPFAWRDWQDFGGGAIGDFGCHILDPVFTALGIRAPLSVGADNTGIDTDWILRMDCDEYLEPGLLAALRTRTS